MGPWLSPLVLLWAPWKSFKLAYEDGSDLSRSQASPLECSSSAKRKRSLSQVDLNGDDQAFLARHFRPTCIIKQGSPNISSAVVPVSVSSNSIATTIKRKYDKVALCVKGHGLCPKRAWSIDSYCEACHG